MSDAVMNGLTGTRRKPREYIELLTQYLAPQRAKVAWLALLLLGGIALQLANPQVIRYFIDTAQSGGSQKALLAAAAVFIGFSILYRVVDLTADYTAQNVGWQATNALRKDLALHCLRLDLPFHKQHTPGELIDRIDGDVTALANFFSRFTIQVLGNALLVAGILALLFREDLRVGAGLAAYTVLTLAALSLIQRLAINRWAAERQASAEAYGFLEERLSGAEEIRALGAEPYVMDRFYRLTREFIKTLRAAFVVGNIAYNLTNLMFAIGYAIALGTGVLLYTHGQASIGSAYLIVYYIGMLSTPLQKLREQWQDLQQSNASIQRIESLFQLQPEVRSPEPASPADQLPPGPFSVDFERVSFSYNGDGNVLHDVDLHLQPGRVLGVLGRTGSGKTTLTRLLFRLYDPGQGAIRLAGCDLRRLPLAELRARIGMVTQDVQLFQASVRDNLTFFNPLISTEQIAAALQTLRLWRWAQSLPKGLDTRLSSGGEGLSAGEAQLLAFTRVFLRNPGLVILDEASARLDPATEALLEGAIDRLFAGRTAILIAHRLHTVLRADDILILEAGRVVEYGPRLQLAADPGSRFNSLLRTGLEEALV